MKIFGIEFLKKSEYLQKIEILSNLLILLSIDEQEFLFYNLFDIIKDNNEYIKYELNYSGKFEFPNLHPKINNFFSIFKLFESGIDEKFGHVFVKNLSNIDLGPIKEYIQIGEIGNFVCYVRYNSLYTYDEEFMDENDNENSNDESSEFFMHFNIYILDELNKNIELKNYEKHIKDEYILKLITKLPER